MDYVDFAGNKISYIKAETGEIVWCQVFVAENVPANYFATRYFLQAQQIITQQ